MDESAGLMINYLYRLDRIEQFHEDYICHHVTVGLHPIASPQGHDVS